MKTLLLLALFASVYVASALPSRQEKTCAAHDMVFRNLAAYYHKVKVGPTEREDCFWCVAELAGTVAGCIAGGWTGVGIVGCISAAIGTGHDCYDCICYVVEELTEWSC